MQFTLENGDTPVLIFSPQDPSFKKFASGCSGGPESPEIVHTADEFAAILPGILQKAATDHRLDPHSYDKETVYITSTVRTCAQITQKMAGSVPIAFDLEDFSTLGPQFIACNSRSYSEHSNIDASTLTGNSHGSPTGPLDDRIANNVLFKVNQREDSDRSHNHLWRDTKGFYVFIGISDYNSYVMKDFYIRRAP